MPKPFYYQVERGVLSLINALKSDTVQTAENSFGAVVMVPDTVVKNPMFPPLFVRTEIINVERLIAQRICLTEGHPRRVDFLVIQPRSHGDTLLSSAGGIGAVYEGEGESKLYYENRPIDVVEANRPDAEQIDVGAQNPRAERLWGWDGATLFLSTNEPVSVEIYDNDFFSTPITQT